jgi:hypothetical protein
VAYRIEVSRLDGAKRTPQGGLRADAALTRSGVFVYHRADGSEVREWRPPEEVFKADSLSTLADAPVTKLHPAEMVNADNFGRYAKGHVNAPRQDGDKVVASVVIQDADLIRSVERGDMREVSCGYTCRIDETPGVTPDGERFDRIQRDVSYNHVAVVPQGRAGSEIRLRLDAADNCTRLDAAKETNMTKVEKIDGVEYEIGSDAHKAACERRDAADKARADEASKLKAERDAAKAELEKARKDAAEAPAKAKAAIEARVALETNARKVLGEAAKFDGKSDEDIVAEVAKAGHPAIKFDGAEPAYVRALFDLAVANAGSLREELSAARVDEKTITGSNDMDRARMERMRDNFSARLDGFKPELETHGQRFDAHARGQLLARMIDAVKKVTRPIVPSTGERVDASRLDSIREQAKQIAEERGLRADAASTAMLERDLLYKIAQPKEVMYAANKARGFVPISTEIDPGAETWAYQVYDYSGEAKVGSSYQGRSPRASVMLDEVVNKIKPVRNSFGWTVQDLRRAAFSGRPLPTMEGDAARRIMENAIDEIIALGVNSQIKGFLNHSSVTVYSHDGNSSSTSLASDGFSALFTSATTAQTMLAAFHGLIAYHRNAVKDMEWDGKVVSLILPPKTFVHAATKPYGTAENSEPALSVLLRTSPFIREVGFWHRLNSIGVSSRNRAVFYVNDASKVQAPIPLDVMAHPTEQVALEFLVELEARVAGTEFYYPGSAAYMDGMY